MSDSDSDDGDDDDASGGGGGNRIESAGADKHAAAPSAVGAAPPPGADATSDPTCIRTKMTKKNDDDGRYVFECDGRKIYEWEQSLEGTSNLMRTDPLWPAAVGTVSPIFMVSSK